MFFTPIIAVADPDPDTPGMLLAKKRGLITVDDYHELYDPRYSIHLIIILRPEAAILEDILATRPARIRILSYHVFEIFWKAIGQEERKLREQNKAMETILNGIQDFISVITPDMTIVDANEAFLNNIGRLRNEVIGRKCYEVLQKDQIDCTSKDAPGMSPYGGYTQQNAGPAGKDARRAVIIRFIISRLMYIPYGKRAERYQNLFISAVI